MNFQSTTIKMPCRIGQRHASNIATEMQKFTSTIYINKVGKDERQANMKSILGLLSICIYPCDKVEIAVSNISEEQAKEDLGKVTMYIKNL